MEIDEVFNLEIGPGNVYLSTESNGDMITIRGCHLTKEQAATIAWILNNEDIKTLKIKIKEK